MESTMEWVIRQDMWKLREAVCLLHSINPTKNNTSRVTKDKTHATSKTYQSARRSILAKKLNCYPHNKVWYVIPIEFVKWAELNSYDIPNNLKSVIRARDSSSISDTIPRNSTIDRMICQAIAKTLWDVKSDYTIAELEKHPAIQIHGGGSQYKGKNTLRNWLSSVDPRSKERKTGRPKNKPSL